MKFLAGLAIVVVLLGVVEIAISSYTEKIFANAILTNPQIHTRPEVAVKSFPNLFKVPDGRTGGLLINLNDAPHASPDIPRANVQVEYSNLRFDQHDLFAGQLHDFSFGEGTGRVYISGSALAEYSGIGDLQFQAADNASPAGTGEDKALLTGTLNLPCGSDGPHPVHVEVRAHVFFWKEGKRLGIDPEKLEKFTDTSKHLAPAQCHLNDALTQHVFKRLSLSLRVPSLPLGIVPQLAFAQAGNLVIVGPTAQSPITGKETARYPGGTSTQARWENLTNYFKFAPQ